MLFLEKYLSEMEINLLGGPFGVFRYELFKKYYAIAIVLEETENRLIEIKTELQKQYDAEMEKLNYDQFEYIGNFHPELKDDFELYHSDVNYAIYNGLFLNAYSLFEISLIVLFKHLQAAKDDKSFLKPSIKRKELIDDFSEKFSINIKENSEWKTFKRYQEIRNSIAHRNGEIHLTNGDNIEENITYKAAVALSENDNILVNASELRFRINKKEFILNFIDFVNKFYLELEKPINDSLKDKD